MHSSLPVAAIALVALLIGCGPKEEGGSPPPGAPGGPAPQVTVATPLIKPIVDWDEYTGRFEAVETSEVRPRVSGTIRSVNFRDGEFAQRGDLLFVIDPRPFEAVLAQARADVQRLRAAATVARTSQQRTNTLLAANAVSKEESEQAQAALLQAEAALAGGEANVRAQALNVEFTRVRAPISGRLSDARLDTGNFVTAGQTVLTTVVKLDPIYFGFDGSEAVYLKYQRANRAGTRPSSRLAANPVEIRLGDEADYRWRGKMDFVDNAIVQGTGTIRGRAVVRNPDGFLTPGLFGHMRLLGSGAYDGMLIPEAAVVTDQTRKVALVVGADNKVAQRVVELGPMVDGLRVVRTGLGRTDRVIIAGVQRARPGTQVVVRVGRIVPPAPGSGPQLPAISTPPATSATAAGAR